MNGKIVKELVSTDSFSFNYIVSYIKSTSNSGSGGEGGLAAGWAPFFSFNSLTIKQVPYRAFGAERGGICLKAKVSYTGYIWKKAVTSQEWISRKALCFLEAFINMCLRRQAMSSIVYGIS